ncbi:MFS transporter [Ilumatobacter sp.]|uniref:MFS transporter n=1 Tax=Ilumatobacter sp. TaxID=1967498 RepID=UPI003AF9B788
MSAPTPTPVRQDRVDTYASLRIPTYRTLFVIGAFGFVATQSQAIARGWLANELSGSNTGLGGVFMAFGVPMLVATPMGGVAADRYSKRTILILTNALLLTSAIWIALAVSFDFVEYWMLLATSAMQATAFSFLVPARMALTGEVVGRELLTNAIVLGQMSMNSARIIGPAIAGVFIGIAWIGTAGVYYFSAMLSIAALIRCFSLPPGRPRDHDLRTSATSEFADSIRYVRRNPHIANLLVVSFVAVMIGFPFVAFLPRYATEIIEVGSSGYGLLAAASAVGAVIVSMYIAGRSTGRAAWRIQAVSGLAFGAMLVVLAMAPSFGTALLAIAALGAASAGFQAMNNSLVLALSDLEYHGRVQSLMMLSFSGFGMAALPLGALADRIGLRETLALMGIGVIAAMVLFLAVSRRTRDRIGDAVALA